MTQKRLFIILAILCFVTFIGIGGLYYFGDMMLRKQTKTLLDKKIDIAALEEEEKSLAQAKKDIEKYKNINEISKAIVPQDKDQAKTVRDILSNAAKSQTPVQSIVFNASTLGQKTPTTTGQNGTSGTATTTPTKTPPPITQVKPVDGIPGVYSMEITLSNTKETATNYASIINFLRNLENSRRTAHIANITLTPDKQNPNIITYAITLKVYIKPETKK